nr:ImmA/IrrE family metallo-endopeptidase [Saprospiraceae bacterium]
MVTTIKLAKSLISPPGDTIQDHLDFMGMSQAELAERMGRPKEKINEIIKGKEPITTPTAFQLEKVLGIPATFWLNRESTYRRELYELELEETYESQIKWLAEFPVRELKKLGWMPNTRKKHELVKGLLTFFGVATTEEWETIYIAQKVSVAFRVSLAHTQSPHAISAWLRMGELQSQELKVNPFDKMKFKKALEEIKELAFLMPKDFTQQLQNICAHSGVLVVYTKNLPKAPISGATRWFHNKPIIQLSDRFKTDDHFWFTFFHEAAHLILHGKKDVFLENVEGVSTDQKKEEEANAFAEKVLLKEIHYMEVIKSGPPTDHRIRDFASKFRTPAGVIIGRLQHRGVIPFNKGNGLKRKIKLFV